MSEPRVLIDRIRVWAAWPFFAIAFLIAPDWYGEALLNKPEGGRREDAR